MSKQKKDTQPEHHSGVFKGLAFRRKNYISRVVMYGAVGYITARSSFKTSWGPAKESQSNIFGHMDEKMHSALTGAGLSDNIKYYIDRTQREIKTSD